MKEKEGKNPENSFFFWNPFWKRTEHLTRSCWAADIERGFLFLTPSVKVLNGCCDTAHIIPSLLIYGCTFASQPWICLSAGHKCAFWKADQLCFCCSNGIFPRKLMCYLFSAQGFHDTQHTWEFKKHLSRTKSLM